MDKNQTVSYTVEAAVQASGLARSRVYKAIGDGSLRSFKAGRRRMVSAKALQDFIARLERESGNGRAA